MAQETTVKKEKKPMTKKTRNLIIMLVVLVLLAGATVAVVLLTQDNSGQSDQLTEQQISDMAKLTLVAEKEEDIASIKTTSANGSLEFYSQMDDEGNRTWTIKGAEDGKLNSSSIQSFVSTTLILMGTEVVEENPSEDRMAEFGFNNPSASVLITKNDGSTITCEVGNASPDSASMYMMREGRNAIFLVDNATASLFSDKLEDYWDIPGNYVNVEQLLKFHVTRKDGDNLIIDLGDDEMLGYSNWVMSEPYYASLDSYQGNQFFSNLTMLAPLYLIDNKPEDLTQYGLDDPQMNLYMEDSDGQVFELNIGSSDGNGNVYVQAPGDPAVYAMLESSLTTLNDLDPFQLIARFTQIYNINVVDKIEATSADRSFEITMDHEKEMDENGEPKLDGKGKEILHENAKSDGKDLQEAGFRSFYQTLVGVSVDGKLEEGAVVEGDAEITFKFTINDGHMETIEYIPYGVKDYAVRKNGADTGLYIEKWRVQQLFEEYDKLMNGEYDK